LKEMCSFLIDEPLKQRLQWACSVANISRSALIREGVNLVTELYLESKGKKLSTDEKLDLIIRRLQSN